ncbi:MAG: hypothetical protein WCH35_14960 [Comamonadaceae bacterium]
MFATLISFFGGSVFRMLWGEISSFMNKKQDYAQEIDRMKLQGELDAAVHARSMESIKLQADLGVKTIQVQAESAIGQIEADAWGKAVEGTTKPTGVKWIDAWNGVIRPGMATWSMVMVSGHYLTWWKMDDNGWYLCGAALGIYLADRALFKRGK